MTNNLFNFKSTFYIIFLESTVVKKAVIVSIILLTSCWATGQCPTPQYILAQNITTNSADIDLSSSGSGPWELEYGHIGFSTGNGTTLQVSGNTTTINSLAPGTPYELRVKRICNTASSGWLHFWFSTKCNSLINAPAYFDFEDHTWNLQINHNRPGQMDSCWNLTTQGSSIFWSVGPAHITRFSTGPEGDHTSGYGKFIYLNGWGQSSDSLSVLEMPEINLSGITGPEISFWYHLFGGDIDSLKVSAKKPSDTAWSTLHTFTGEQQLSQTDQWKKLTLSLGAYAGNSINIQLEGYGTGTDLNMAIDDLSIRATASCQPSSYFRNVSNNDTSVLLDWDAGSSTTHQIEYGKKGFTPGSGTLITTSQHPLRISNLSPDSTYVFYLRDDCGSSQYSSWSGPLEVHTDCSPVYAPYFNDFEGSDWVIGRVPQCWDKFDYLDVKWSTGPAIPNNSQSGPSFNNHTPGGSQYILVNRPLNQTNNARSSITTPLIDLDTIANPEIKFWTHMFGVHIQALEAYIDSGDGFELIRRINGYQQLSSSDSWSEQIILLPAYSGKTIKLKLTGIATSNRAIFSKVAVDDLFIGEAPSCRKPTELAFDSIGFTTASVSWLSGGANNWIVRYQANGGPVTFASLGSNTHFFNSLQPGTEYTVWVRDSCGVGDVSDWSAPLTFRAYCLPDTTPYFQDFEGNEFAVRTGWPIMGHLGPCWKRSNEIGALWQPSPANAYHNPDLPTHDHTTGNGKYIGGAISPAGGVFVTNNSFSFTSKHIDLSNLTTPELTFWYFLGGLNNTPVEIRVEVNKGTGWQLVNTIYGPQQQSITDPWRKHTVSLAGYANDTIQLRFVSFSFLSLGWVNAAVGIDDVSIHEMPACVAPAQLSVDHVNYSRAHLSWLTGGAADWIVKYRPVGGGFQYRKAAVSDSFELGGLSPNTRYEVWVRDSCSSDVSTWVGPTFFKTDCLPATTPFYESFDGPAWFHVPYSIPPYIVRPGQIDGCWKRSDSSYIPWVTWQGASPGQYSGPMSDHGGTGKYMLLEEVDGFNGMSILEVELMTPFLSLAGLQKPELNFWFHMYGQNIQKLEVYAERVDGSRTFINDIIGQQHTSKTAPWTLSSNRLTGFKDDTIKIVFVGYIHSQPNFSNIAIDDVEIIDSVCSDPVNLNASNITSNSADLSWTSLSAQSNIQYGNSGFTLGSGTVILGVSSGHGLSGLQPITTYHYYVQDSCRDANSAWVGPFSFTTYCAPPVADFSYQGPGQLINFDGSNSSGAFLNYYWEFGDGDTGTGVTPSHTYAAAGMYNVALITTDSCGLRDTLIKNVQVCDDPQAVINYNRNGLVVRFNGNSSPGATQFHWDLGPAGVYVIAKPIAGFPAKGTYPIYLAVTNACGGTDTTYVNLVLCDKPSASFTSNIIGTNSSGMVVDFDGTASSFVNSFKWDFGDGNTDSTSLTPRHTYTTPGLHYTVTLITYADCGLSDTLAYKLNSIGLDEYTGGLMSVYPNPASERITVFAEEGINAEEIYWFDVSGRLLHIPISIREVNSIEYDVSDLAAGEYYLISNSLRGKAIKVVVQ